MRIEGGVLLLPSPAAGAAAGSASRSPRPPFLRRFFFSLPGAAGTAPYTHNGAAVKLSSSGFMATDNPESQVYIQNDICLSSATASRSDVDTRIT